MHPDGTACGGIAIIIKNTIKNTQLHKFNKQQFWATGDLKEFYNKTDL